MHNTQSLDSLVIFCESFLVIFGEENPFVNDEKSIFSKVSMFLSMVFYSVEDKHHFPPLSVSNKIRCYRFMVLTQILNRIVMLPQMQT